jgi:cell division protein FtsI/penicillin-binding protein 2
MNMRRTIFFCAVLVIVFGLLAARCVQLQIGRRRYYGSICERQQQARVTAKPRRGPILDCRGRILAASNSLQTIFAEPRLIENPGTVCPRLGDILDMDPDRVRRIITESKNPGFARIKVAATHEQCAEARKIYGIGVSSDWRRHYPMGPLASHVVGFTSADGRGLAGIELQYDSRLKGDPGEQVFMADAFRRPVRPKSSRLINDGVGIILTIDAAIQQFARSELEQQYETYRAESAVAIVMDPTDGAVLAMVCLPDFEPRYAGLADPDSLRNRALWDQYEPGSLMKPIAVAIAVDWGVVDPGEKIFCEFGSYRGRGFGRIGEYGDHKFGKLAIRDILVKSSNIGAAKIGQRLGAQRLYRGLSFFGFGKKTGLNLGGEAVGLMRPPEEWTGYSVTRIPFGQEISATAIQLVRAFCILANGGRSIRPYVVKAVVDNDGRIVRLKRPPPGIGFVVAPEVARWIVTEALAGVVNEGTGKRAALDDWQVFGKTGTASIACADEKGYEPNAYVASFIGGAPAERPAAVVLVSITRPLVSLGKGYTGGTVAAPVAGRILAKTLNYLGVPKHGGAAASDITVARSP